MRELLFGSKIYVYDAALQKAKKAALSQTVLSRHLLQIMFKKEALHTCSIRGIKKSRDDEGRLALHSGAVNAILGNYKYTLLKE